ncbi:hypothetical protein GF314_08745, partial [bacterium]|nr:hypothetical protein [bacterium]
MKQLRLWLTGVFLVVVTATALASVGADGPFQLKHRFRHLSIEDGMSQSSVHALLQDRSGFVWIATQDGINRFDGRHFRIWKTDPDAVETLNDPYITCMAEDSLGNLWLGSETSGFGRFDPDTWRFDHVCSGPVGTVGEPTSKYEVSDLEIGPRGQVWVATLDHGVLCYDPVSRSLRSLEAAEFVDVELSALHVIDARTVLVGSERALYRLDVPTSTATAVATVGINTIVTARDGTVWLGTRRGLARLETDSRRWVEVLARDDMGDEGVVAIAEGPDGHLWLGGDAVICLDPRTGETLTLTADLHDPLSLQTTEIQSLLVDASGVLWVGHDLGTSLLDTRAKRFYHFHREVDRSGTLSHNTVWGICEDRRGQVWVATQDGLNVLDPRTGEFRVYHGDPSRDDRPSSSLNTMVREDSRGRIWIGNAFGALDLYDPRTGRFRHFARDPSGQDGAPSLRVYDQAEDPDGVIWQATYDGLQSYDPRTGTFTAHFAERGSVYDVGGLATKCIEIGPDGIIWLGTNGGGVLRIDPVAGTRQ